MNKEIKDEENNTFAGFTNPVNEQVMFFSVCIICSFFAICMISYLFFLIPQLSERALDEGNECPLHGEPKMDMEINYADIKFVGKYIVKVSTLIFLNFVGVTDRFFLDNMCSPFKKKLLYRKQK